MARKKEVDCLVDVALIAAIRRPLTYRVPRGMDVRTGHRVLVPLGARQAKGIVLEPVGQLAPGVKIREILQVLDPEPIVSPELLTLGLWIAEYYVAPVGEVFRAMLPLLPEQRRVRVVRMTEKGARRLGDWERSLVKEAGASGEAALLRYVRDYPDATLESVQRKFRATDLVARTLDERWISVTEVERDRGHRPLFSVRLRDSASGPSEPSDDAGLAQSVHGPVPERPLKLSPVAQRILEALAEQGPAEDHRELLKQARASLAHLKKLSESGLVTLAPGGRAGRLSDAGVGELASGTPPFEIRNSKFEIRSSKLETRNSELETRNSELENWESETGSGERPRLELTAAQALVLEDLAQRLARREFSTVLLHGVTGSGKTEIYLRAIDRCLALGRSALMLVPEIALTPAMEARFVERFGRSVAVLHSGLAAGARHEAWWRVARGEARVALGTRSAVFAPLAELGLVIVDEEHDASYKQQETPRYHGRDAAIVRARLARAVAVLGSATPSLESYHNAQQRKYTLARLPERVAGRPLATVEIVDMREEFRQTFTKIPVSRRLKSEIDAQLASGAQTLILLNRRGYSWYLLCRSCGLMERCINCSISLTYHRREHRLICHYCGYSVSVPSRCRACGSEYLHYVGEGTEKIEDKFAELFPGARVARLDRDVARRAGQFERILGDVRDRKIDILIGTQLIAKGHHFPGVTLVGVVSADQGLGFPDFRAAERTFQLLAQVAGRAGRGDAPGRVLVQTFYPDHYAIRLAAEQNYEAFFAKEMRFRRMMHYPPLAALANVIAQHAKLEEAARIARRIADFLASPAATGGLDPMKLLGPSPAPLARLEGRYRIQFLIKAGSRAQLNQLLQRVADYCEAARIPPRAVIVDADALSVM